MYICICICVYIYIYIYIYLQVLRRVLSQSNERFEAVRCKWDSIVQF